MKCPICINVDLMMSDRQGVEIDYCPQCRGIWLDRGELDKIIERSAGVAPPAEQRVARVPDHQDYPHSHDQRHHSDHGYHNDQRYHGEYGRKKRRGSFLEELFDFD